ncbi:hypothetical protein PHO31112_04729 [Pandoraea horticolens]|uniref:Uncharacterized protein n=1 Tax=Pandoraea horticolens TaxID=2508298 RepID=A0A5E4YS24_9BURK|nr:hypothetical protein PHO31112_04729 [Pandoraea horticolens]
MTYPGSKIMMIIGFACHVGQCNAMIIGMACPTGHAQAVGIASH